MAESPRDDDITTTSTTSTGQADPTLQRRCPVCWSSFTRVRRQQYCSDNCRKTAWNRQRAAGPSTPPAPPPGRRRDVTVYSCPSCDTRIHGQQWCPDCNQPCTRVGLGGLCPHCDEPVAITELLHLQEAPQG